MASYSIKHVPNIQNSFFAIHTWPRNGQVPFTADLVQNCAYLSEVLTCPRDMLGQSHLNIYKAEGTMLQFNSSSKGVTRSNFLDLVIVFTAAF